MADSIADLILHPVRLRIIQALVGGRNLTAQQLVEELQDIAPATLYRHLNKLSSGGVLVVVDQHQVRGAVEKVYGLPETARLTAEDVAAFTVEDHLRYFMSFLMSLYSDFQRYVSQRDFDMLRDGAGYRQVPMYLDDEEFVVMSQKLQELVIQGFQNEPRPGRKRRMFSTILIPEVGRDDTTGES